MRFFLFSSRRRHTRLQGDWSSDVCSSDLRLLLVAHHLVVDGVSWRILLEDLRSAYASRLQGLEPARVHKTASYQRWSQALQAHAAQCGGELAFWQALAQVPAGLPCARDRKSTRLNSSHLVISYAVFCLKKKNKSI